MQTHVSRDKLTAKLGLVKKERFVTIPGGNTDEDTTPLVGWAGWNHLERVMSAVHDLDCLELLD